MKTKFNDESEILAFNKEGAGKILLKGATILSMDEKIGDLLKGDVMIEGSKIIEVGEDLSKYESDDTIVMDMTDYIILPGLADAHRHCWQGQMRRSWPDVSNIGEYIKVYHDDWAVVYRPEDVYIGNLLAAYACIDSGVTNMCDFMHNTRTGEHADAAVNALMDSGIRGVESICPAKDLNITLNWADEMRRINKRYFSSKDQLLRLRAGGNGATFAPPQMLLTKDKFMLARELDIGADADGTIGDDSSNFIEASYKGGWLDERTLLTHCDDLSDRAWEIIKETGTAVALTPTSDANYGIGSALSPIQKVIDLGMKNVGIGIDTEINVPSDLFAVMQGMDVIQRLCAFYQRFENGGVETHPGLEVKDIVYYATLGGARAMMNDDQVGSLTPGKEADLIAINNCTVNNIPMNNAYGTVVCSANAAVVDLVMIGGEIRKYDGKLVNVDVKELQKKAVASRDYILEKSGYQPAYFDRIKVNLDDRNFMAYGEGFGEDSIWDS